MACGGLLFTMCHFIFTDSCVYAISAVTSEVSYIRQHHNQKMSPPFWWLGCFRCYKSVEGNCVRAGNSLARPAFWVMSAVASQQYPSRGSYKPSNIFTVRCAIKTTCMARGQSFRSRDKDKDHLDSLKRFAVARIRKQPARHHIISTQRQCLRAGSASEANQGCWPLRQVKHNMTLN